MIHNIATHCKEIASILNQTKGPYRFFVEQFSFQGLSKKLMFRVSNETPVKQESSQKKQEKKVKNYKKYQKKDNNGFTPIDYYRNTIRRVNIRANGKGKFSSYNLQQIIYMSTKEQHAKIMFEAYYNYMGHFAMIPNKVVDSLVIKAMHIGNQTDQVLEIFAHHNYLAYFPHYNATNKVISTLINDQNNLQKILRILIRSPLIKINLKIVNTLIAIAQTETCQETTREYVLKVLLFRRKLVDSISQEDLLARMAGLLQKVECSPFQPKPMVGKQIKDLLSETPSSSEDLVNRLILSSAFSFIEQSAGSFCNSQEEIGSQFARYFDYLEKLYQRSSKQVNYGAVLKNILAQSKLSMEISEKLQNLANGEQQ